MSRGVAALALAATLGAGLAHAQTPGPDAADVRHAVDQFLDTLGNRRLDMLPAMFAPKATLTVVRQREGTWTLTTQTAEEWLAGLKAQAAATTFSEPLTGVMVHVESGQLAHVRADFTVVSDGQVRSHGVDYFTLVKDSGTWKLAHAAYTSIPGAP